MQLLEDKNDIGENLQKLKVVWAVLLTSQLFLLLLAFFAKKELFDLNFSQPLAGKNPVMVLVAACLSLTAFVLSFVLKAGMLKQAEEQQNAAFVRSALVLSCALCESISLVGLLLAFAADYPYFFLWFALGIFGIILHFPKKKHLIAASYKK